MLFRVVLGDDCCVVSYKNGCGDIGTRKSTSAEIPDVYLIIERALRKIKKVKYKDKRIKTNDCRFCVRKWEQSGYIPEWKRWEHTVILHGRSESIGPIKFEITGVRTGIDCLDGESMSVVNG